MTPDTDSIDNSSFEFEVKSTSGAINRLNAEDVLLNVYLGTIGMDDQWRIAGEKTWHCVASGYSPSESPWKKCKPRDSTEPDDEISVAILAAPFIENCKPYPEVVLSPPAARTSDKREWEDKPATSRQLAYLRELGLAPTKGLSSGQASDWVRLLRRELPLPSWHLTPMRFSDKRGEWANEPAMFLQIEELKRYGLEIPKDLNRGEYEDWIAVLVRSKEAQQAKRKIEFQEMAGATAISRSYLYKIEIQALYKTGEKGDATDGGALNKLRQKWWRGFFYEADKPRGHDPGDWIPNMSHPHLIDACANHIYEKMCRLGSATPSKPTLPVIQEILNRLDDADPTWDMFYPARFFQELPK